MHLLLHHLGLPKLDKTRCLQSQGWERGWLEQQPANVGKNQQISKLNTVSFLNY
jgi:hypothetical protein